MLKLFHIGPDLILSRYGVDAHRDIYMINEDGIDDERIGTVSLDDSNVGSAVYKIKGHYGYDYRQHDILEVVIPAAAEYKAEYEIRTKV